MGGFNRIGAGLFSLSNASNAVTLQGGQATVLPSGQYLVLPGKYTFFQFYDPVSLTWKNFQCPLNQQPFYISSDGYNFRLANMTGCCVGGIVTNGGTANTAKNGFWAAGSSSTTGVVCTTTTPTGGTAATFNCIVGGEINTSVTVNTGGSGYLVPPLVTFGPPPAGGLQATGYATLTSGAVSSVTVKNQGAGYTSAPPVTFTPCYGDPGTGATATATVATTNAGKLVAVTMANNGSLYTSVPTATVSGLAGSPAVTPIMCFAVTTATTVSSATNRVANQLVYCAQLSAASNTTTNPDYTTGIFQVRNGLGVYNTSSSLAAQAILDGGLSQLDVANLCVSMDSPAAASATATYASGASGAVTDQSFVIPI